MQTYTQRQLANTSSIEPVLMRAVNSSSNASQTANEAIKEITEIKKQVITVSDVYPVGSIYQTTEETADPNILFSGTWINVTKTGDAVYSWERTE